MLVLDRAATRRALPYPALIEALRTLFASGCEVPKRHHHTVKVPGEVDATLLLMPAWREGDAIGVKLVTVFPGNGARGLPAVSGNYLVLSARTGELVAMVDGGELTARRTAAASALAADRLARPDASHLLVVGAGRVAGELPAAHASVRPITRVSVWARREEQARALAERLVADGVPAAAVTDLAGAVAAADIISCATLSTTPVVEGDWLRPGQHLDLVGAFTPAMRECDADAVRKSLVFVDTREGALSEGGDLTQAAREGAFSPERVEADLAELCRGSHPGRTDGDAITLFKSVGTALEDLAAGLLAMADAPAEQAARGETAR